MNIYIKILLGISFLVAASVSHQITKKSFSNILPKRESSSFGGFWKTKTEWKAYWVKDWVIKKVYVPIWKHVWGPTQVKEWVPTGIAKPHPGWKPSGKIL